ncbi:hypothetical protein V2J09_021814 [Rumex salicifolius]
MSSDGLSHLCRLVDVSLRHHKEVVELVELSREKERTLLISLSKLFRQIQGWITAEQPDKNGECCTSVCENHQCLTYIVDTLFSFLTVESKYVHHLVGKILVVVAKLIAGALCNMQTNWKSFVDLICICLEVAISNAFLHSTANQIEHLKYGPPSPAALHMGLKNSNWRTVATVLLILRAIIKALEVEENDNENDVESLEILLSSVSMCFAKMPWDTLDASLTHGIIIDQVISSNSSLKNATVTESTILLLGSLVQLFCSLVKTVHENEGLPTLKDKPSLIQKIETILPQLSVWCLAKEWIQHDMHILPYFQHKILMLMSRLGSQLWTCCSTVQLWLQLLQKFYGDILTKPISLTEKGQDNCLEDSPFLWSSSNQENNHLSSCHLQRQSIFLFLRLSMCLIVRQESKDVICTCGTVELVSKSDSETVERCNATRKCLLDFCEWIQFRFPYNRISDNEIYSKKCMDFSSSFIKLYIHEDDLLFEVLLHMFNVATYADEQTVKAEGASLGADEDALFYISELFNPILMFHAFVAELKYDHQLLLDYLISKDSGTRCAEYLLKSLRKVCDSWKMFAELDLGLESDGKQFLKKQKISLESIHGRTPTASQSRFAVSNKVQSKDDYLQSKISGAKSLYFAKAKTCMLSLKNALEKLHKRSLFPYNPEVLLRRTLRLIKLTLFVTFSLESKSVILNLPKV